MIECKNNYKSMHDTNICDYCQVALDDQEHVLACSITNKNGCRVINDPFTEDLDVLKSLATEMIKSVTRRKEYSEDIMS